MSRELIAIFGQRLWQSFAGLVTVFLVTRYLSSEEQGWYYTFLSVAAWYSIFEMGLSTALVQSSGHFFRGMRWGPSGGLEGAGGAYFSSFFSQAVRVYIWLAGSFACLVLLFGGAFFSSKTGNSAAVVAWQFPWLGLVLATSAAMVTLPFLSIAEGTGSIAEAYAVRLGQGVAGALACWVLLATGGALWASVAVPFAGIVVAWTWLLCYRKKTVSVILRTPKTGDFDWRREIWPLQWRLGVGWLGVYFMSQLATPILFYFQDSVVAGQMGLTLTIVHMLGLLSQAPLAKVVPAMSTAVVQRSWRDLETLFKQGVSGFCLLFGAGTAVLWMVNLIVQGTPFAERILPSRQLAELLVFVFFFQLNLAFGSQLRALRQEPLVWIYVAGGVLTFLGSWAMAATGSSAGVIRIMVLVQAGALFPACLFVWRSNLRQWRYSDD
ncbi:MAG: hypothetical protein CK604_05265 [Curvibacter sp. PD_MW3]|nr:MAG: hypothetical protein CK604_05265 [Curvibacter sp. PD_MW3]